MTRHRILELGVTLLLPIACHDAAAPVARSLPASASAAERQLDGDGPVTFVPRDYSTIQGAVDATPEGGTIMVAAGVYHENVVIRTSHLRLRGAGGDVILDGSTPGLTGIGVHVLGQSATMRTVDVEVSGLEVRNYVRGIIVQFATGAVVSHNYVHDNVDKAGTLVLGNGTGIELVTTSASDVSHNLVTHNGLGGIQLRVGSTDNAVHENRIEQQNGWQSPTVDGVGIMATGAGTNDNRIEFNTILDSFGRGIMVARPLGSTPLISGTLVAHNQAHRNQRAGITVMDAATNNTIVHNDARDNNLSGLPPCYRCNLFDNSVGTNTWEKNLGTFSGTDHCAP